jgi:hypothetical protein
LSSMSQRAKPSARSCLMYFITNVLAESARERAMTDEGFEAPSLRRFVFASWSEAIV